MSGVGKAGEAVEAATPLEALEVALAQVAPDPDQPRRRVEAGDVVELAESVRAHGVVQPLVVRPHPARGKDGPRFMIITGERRWAAAREAGRKTVPVVVRKEELGAADLLMMQLDENDGALRQELTLAERAAAVVRAYELSGLRKEEFAARHKKSASWLSHFLTIAKARGVMREALDEGRLPGIRAAVEYAKLPAADKTRLLAAARRSNEPLSLESVREVNGARGAGAGNGRAGDGGEGEGSEVEESGGPEGSGAAAGGRATAALTSAAGGGARAETGLGALGERPSSAAGNFLAAGAAIARQRNGGEEAR
ncbi:MAG TPA: ParB/RepB/Spo0J family partition protein, partial [Thermoanaerobaculia bacterium]|nr:ParB/RepB/Spo0J family partition protein [Thermoanaerobaculia bacterium]